MSDGLTLYGYWRSSAAYRVRIALNLKGLSYEAAFVNIAPGTSEQMEPDYYQKNAQMRVPAIETSDGVLGQSMAILEWLEETYTEPALWPEDAWQRAQARAFANVIACDIHPLNNLSVLKRLSTQFDADQAATADWYRHWIVTGFTALEEGLNREPPKGQFLFGDTPSIAEICLVPQVSNAHRFNVDMSPFPTLARIDAECRKLDAFEKADPRNQPDATG